MLIFIRRDGRKWTLIKGKRVTLCREVQCTNRAKIKGGKCYKHSNVVTKKCVTKECRNKAPFGSTKCGTCSGTRKTCSTPKCKSIAIKNGKCQGCNSTGGLICTEEGCSNPIVRPARKCALCKERSTCCKTPECNRVVMKNKLCRVCLGIELPKCSTEGCKKVAKRDGKCIACSGVASPKCKTPGCGKIAIYKDKCSTCKGIERPKCSSSGCTKFSAKNGLCLKCGNVERPRCVTDGCTSLQIAPTKLCMRHGGGLRCKTEDCDRRRVPYSDHCLEHCSDEQLSRERERRRNARTLYYKNNPIARIAKAISGRIRISIKKKTCSREYTGCSSEQLRAHLEASFDDEMSWDNYGQYGWHVDHIRPISSFDLSDPEQIKVCFHYTNLQALWWFDNLAKSDKYDPVDEVYMDDDSDDEE